MIGKSLHLLIVFAVIEILSAFVCAVSPDGSGIRKYKLFKLQRHLMLCVLLCVHSILYVGFGTRNIVIMISSDALLHHV